jgi:hypothetical protein
VLRAMPVHKVLLDHRDLEARRAHPGPPVRMAMPVPRVLLDHKDRKALRAQPARWGPKAHKGPLARPGPKAHKVLPATDCGSWLVRRQFPVVRRRPWCLLFVQPVLPTGRNVQRLLRPQVCAFTSSL